MDGDTAKCRRLSLVNLSGILNNNLWYSPDGRSKRKLKARFSHRNTYSNRSKNHETVTPSSDTYLDIYSIKNGEANRKHVRKNLVDLKKFKNRLSSHKIPKGKMKDKVLESHHDIYDEKKCESTERGSKKYLPSSSFSELKYSKSNSSDLFGFRRCHRRRRYNDYNMSVIYKLLGKEFQDKNSQHDILKCKHYSIENVPKDKKKSSLVHFENEIPTRYALINFTQYNSTTDTYMTESKKKKPCPNLDRDKNKSILKKFDDIMTVCTQPVNIETKGANCKSVCTQPIKIKTNEKSLATADIPISNPRTLRKTVVNVCQHSNTKFQYPRHDLDEKKCNIREKPKKDVKITLKPLTILKSVIRHFLSVIVVMVWLPCLIIIGFFWLISYFFRPHSCKTTSCQTAKNKKYCTQKKQNRKKKSKNKRYVDTNKYNVITSWLPQIPLGLCAKKIYSNMSICSHNTTRSIKSLTETSQNQNKTGACFFKPATMTLAFPCERRKHSKDRKRCKFASFHQAFGKCDEKNPKTTLGCPELYLNRKHEAPCNKNSPAYSNVKPEKLQSSCQNKNKKYKSCKQKQRNVDICVSKKIFNLLQTTLTKRSEAKRSTQSVQLPKSENICNLKKIDRVKSHKMYNRKCSPICSKDFCKVSSDIKVGPDKPHSSSCKKSAQTSYKTNAVIKFFPPPQKTKERCIPSDDTASIEIGQLDSEMKATSVVKFFPCPRQKINSASSGTVPKPCKTKGLQRTKHTRTVPLSPVVKFLPRDRHKSKLKSKSAATFPLKTTSIIKFVPSPEGHLSIDMEHSKEPASSEEGGEGDEKVPAKEKAPKTSTVVKFFPEPRPSRRTLGSTSDLVKNTRVLKIFPAPRFRTRTLGINTKAEEKKVTHSRKIESKTPMHIIKFYPKASTRTKDQGSAARVEKEKSLKGKSTSGASSDRKPTSIIKFFPSPRHRTRTLTTNTESSTYDIQTALTGEKRQKYLLEKKEKESDPCIKKRKDINLDREKCKIRSVTKYYLEKPCDLSHIKEQSRAEHIKQKEKKEEKKGPKIKQRTKKIMFIGPGSGPKVIKFFPCPRHRQEKRSTQTRELTINTAIRSSSRIKSRRTQSEFPLNLKPCIICKPCKVKKKPLEAKGTSLEMKGKSLESKGKSLESKGKSLEMKGKSLEMKRKSLEMKRKSHEMKGKSHEMKGKSHEMKRKSHEMKRKSDKLKTKPRTIKGKPQKVKAKPHKVKPKPHKVKAKPRKRKTKPQKKKIKPRKKKIKPHKKKKKPQKKKKKPHKKKIKPRKKKIKPHKRKIKPHKRKIKPHKKKIKRHLGKRKHHIGKRKHHIGKRKRHIGKGKSPYKKREVKAVKMYKRMKHTRLYKIFAEGGDCNAIMGGGKQPCLWIKERWPSVYPAFLVFNNIYNNMIHILFFALAACVWCPLFCWCFMFYFFVIRKLIC